MERRTLLKTAGSIGATATIGGAGILATSGSAAAAEIGTFALDGGSTTTDDGTIESFTLDNAEVSVEYDGLDTEAVGIAIGVGVFGPSGSENVLASKQFTVADQGSLDTNAGTFTTSFGPIDVLENSPWTPADFEDTTEGDGGKSTDVTFVCLFEIFGPDENGDGEEDAITPGGQPDAIYEEGTVTVTVTNETATSGVGGDGDVSVDGENQEN